MFDYLAALALFCLVALGKNGRIRRRITCPQQAILHSHLRGKAICANDSDNIRFLHIPTPFHLIWEMLMSGVGGGRRRMNGGKETLNIRLAGIDAPECAHWGLPGQPYSQAAREWLSKRVAGRFVCIQPLRIDQYNRIVAAVWAPKWVVFWSCVSLEMIQAGYATVYTGSGAVYPQVNGKSLLGEFEKAEARARKRQCGMWKQLSDGSYVSPAVYKQQNREK